MKRTTYHDINLDILSTVPSTKFYFNPIFGSCLIHYSLLILACLPIGCPRRTNNQLDGRQLLLYSEALVYGIINSSVAICLNIQATLKAIPFHTSELLANTFGLYCTYQQQTSTSIHTSTSITK